MKAHLESIAALGLVALVVVGFYLLVYFFGGDCISGSTERMCGMRW